MSTYVIVHGAWHTGAEFEPTAAYLRAAGHTVHLPTLAGNRPGDPKDTGLTEAIDSLVEYLESNKLSDVVLAGHSYGGMVITGGRTDRRLRRLEALLCVADEESSFIISGNGDVIEPEHDLMAIGSGGPYAQAAALALLRNTELDAGTIVEKALQIAGDICVYTNQNIVIETLPAGK